MQSPSARRASWIRGVAAVLVALALLVGMTPLNLRIPVAGSILLVAVIYASFDGGLAVGLTAGALAEASLIGYNWSQGNYTTGVTGPGGPLVEGLAFGFCVLATAVMVGVLRKRSERRLSLERDHRERMGELERIKSQFLNIASHELRGPISVARGYASMLADGTFGPPEATNVTTVMPIIVTKLEEMNQLVDSMLDTARLEERRLVLVRERTDLRDLVDRAVAAVQLLLTHHHDLRWRRPRIPIVVDGDRARLSIIVTNLLQNAIKYSPEGGIVEVFLAHDGDRATLTVWDQGLGIADADLPRLFTRFGRIITPGNSHIPGTGLGLYLARELARMHDGDLVVTSALGRGSSFTLMLPLCKDRTATPNQRSTTSGRRTPMTSQPRRRPAAGSAGSSCSSPEHSLPSG
jgi:signal transduction histidine kinase